MEDRRGRNSGRQFQRRYGFEDIRLLAEVDEAFGQMSGLATCEILRREYRVHGDSRFVRLANLSRSHLYNLRRSRTCQTKRRVWNKTRGSCAAIAVRKYLGHQHIPVRFAEAVDDFTRKHHSPVVHPYHPPTPYPRRGYFPSCASSHMRITGKTSALALRPRIRSKWP